MRFPSGLAGGGIKGGNCLGKTDELGYRFVEDGQEMNVHDLHARCFTSAASITNDLLPLPGP